MLITQYSVMAPNTPGQLARLTETLARAGVNLAGVTSVNLGASTCLKFLADCSARVKRRVERAGYRLCESKVFRLTIPPGVETLNRVASELAAQRINILSCYGHADQEGTHLILAVDQPAKAAPLIERSSQRASRSREEFAGVTAR